MNPRNAIPHAKATATSGSGTGRPWRPSDPLSRRAVLGLPLALVGAAPAWAAGRVTLTAARDLRVEAKAAFDKGQVLVVMASLDGCPFCIQVRDAFLGPLRDERGQAIVQVDLRKRVALRGFDGEMTTHDAQTQAWKISVTPTVLFFGPDGRELAPRLVGAYLPDFYGAYLDDRLLAARKALGA